MKEFFNRLLDGNDRKSSKRFVTLLISFHFIVASFVTLFIAFYVIFYVPKGVVDKDLLNLLKEILHYDFIIILGGLGFVTADGLIQVIIEKAKIKAQSVTTPTEEVPPTE